MGTKHFTIALLCVVLYSLRSDGKHGVAGKNPFELDDVSLPDTGPSSSSFTDNIFFPQQIATGVGIGTTTNDPNESILGPQRRRKIIRRTRRRRLKKPKPTSPTESADVSYITSSSTESALKPEVPLSTPVTTSKPVNLSVVPISYEQSSATEESASVSTQTTTKKSLDPFQILRPGHYTRHQRKKVPAKKSNLWKVPNFSMELFDTDATDEDSNLDKRESSDMFSAKPTALSNLPDMHTDESINNPFINTSLPISTELQNSLQFTLQGLHPLLNSDSVLWGKEQKIPENKTVAVTHSLSSSPAETPVEPDLRFVPTHLRKSHPLLSDDSFINSQNSVSKLGPRVNVHLPGMHSIRNDQRSTSTTTEKPVRNRARSTTSATTTTTTTTTRRTTTTTPSTTTSRRTTTQPSTSPTTSRRTSTTTTTPKPRSVINENVDQIGNLKITEIVYPTVAQKGSDMMKGYTSSSSTPKSSSTSSTTSAKPPPLYENFNNRSPPLILMGTDASASEIDLQSKGSIESPPAFDDLLLEELVKGFNPAMITKEPSTTPSTTTTTSTTRTTTTPAPTTTTRRSTTTTTTTSTTTTTTEAPKMSDDEANQLLELLNLLQQPQTTEALKTSTVNPTNGKLNDDLLKNLALLENLLSPTAKTMIKEAVDSGTTEKIKATKDPSGGAEGLSDADLKAIYMLLDTMSSTTARPTTTTTPKPTIHPALQGMLTMLTNPWSDIQKMRAQQASQAQTVSVVKSAAEAPKPVFSLPEPPKPVPTSSSFDLLSQLFNLNTQQTEKPKVNQNLGLGALFESLMPKRQPSNREATSGSNQLLNFFQPEQPVVTPPAGPYYWFDVNAFLGNDPTSPMSGFRPKIGTRDYFLKVRKRRDSMEMA